MMMQRELMDASAIVPLDGHAQRAIFTAECQIARQATCDFPWQWHFDSQIGCPAEPEQPLRYVHHQPISFALRHQLCAYMAPPLVAAWEETDRTPIERRVLDENMPELLHCVNTGLSQRMRELLQNLAMQLTHGQAHLRTGQMRVRGSDRQVDIHMPSAEQADAQLTRIAERLFLPRRQHALSEAAQILALVVNAHAFGDGNGRLSRLLFNFVLRQQGTLPHSAYVPVFAGCRAAGGGYEIRLRQAELHGNYSPLVTFFARMIAVGLSGVPTC